MYMIDHYVPVFARLNELLRQAENSESLGYEIFRAELVREVEKASADAGDTAGDALAREATFAVVTFVDEQVLSSNWSQRHQWAGQLLQKKYFNTTKAGVQFFEVLDRLNPFNPRERDVQEVFFYCLCLGLKGQFYRPGDSVRLNGLIKACGDELISVDDDALLFPRAYPNKATKDYRLPQRPANWRPLYVGLPLVLLAGLYLVFQNDIVSAATAFLMMV